MRAGGLAALEAELRTFFAWPASQSGTNLLDDVSLFFLSSTSPTFFVPLFASINEPMRSSKLGELES